MKRALLLLAGCSDFDLPSALTRPQIVAVRATPAAIAPGERAELDALVAGPDGVLAPPLAWTVLSGPGAIEGSALVAGDTAGDVVLALDAGGLAAEKTVTVGERRDNPVIELPAELTVAAGDTLALAAGTPEVSWYATLGAIERYRDRQTELVAPDAPGEGTLIAVGRDGEGGVAWAIARLVVSEIRAVRSIGGEQ